jgi:hypothetical protein
VGEIGAALEISGAKSDVAGGATGLILFPEKPDPKRFSGVSIMPMGIHQFLDQVTAAGMNGAEPVPKRALAIGAGAFGSQVLNNLVRAGVGTWTIVDNDLLLPHNLARHLLPVGYVGQNKAEAAVEAFLTGSINIDSAPVKSVPADLLNPREHEEALREAEAETDLIFDFSASVAVARHIGRRDGKARCVSGFVTPGGNGMVALLEDTGRHFRLDWLEVLHYRAILHKATLEESLNTSDGQIRTGGSCRDISVVLAQADTAVWAGTFCQQIGPLLASADAAVKIGTAASAACGFYTSSKVKALPWGCCLIDFLILVAWVFIVTAAWVKPPALAYGERLLESCEAWDTPKRTRSTKRKGNATENPGA